MYIGTHCEQEDPYSFLSAHCVLGTSIYIGFLSAHCVLALTINLREFS